MQDALLESRWGRPLVGGAAAGAGLAGAYAATGYTPAFLVSPIERVLARTMPGAVITFAIENLGNLGQQLNLLTAVVLAWVLLSLGATGAILAGQEANNRILPALGTGVFTWTVTVGLTGELVLSLGPALPTAGIVAIAQAVDAYGGRAEPISSKRRRAMSTIGVAVGATTIGFGAGERKTEALTSDLELSAPGADPVDIENKLDTAERRSLDVRGIEPLVSENFYEVDINSIDPSVDAEEWSLTITGAVEQDVEFSYGDIQRMEAINQFSTIRCVGDSLNGQKIDTALWTGVPLQDLVAEASVDDTECDCVLLRSADGYEVEFPMEAFNSGLAVYGMNGNVLPRGHGYPVRAVIPGHWGEVNTKWLTEIELLEREVDGYWEQRGWEGTGPVKPTATLHHDAMTGDSRRLVAGQAYGGTRGVSAVDVSTDGGSTWTEAALSEPLPAVDGEGRAADAWRQWQYSYEPPGETHEVVVRMIDESGTVQTEEETGPYPTGPSGWVSQEFQS